MFLKRNNGYTEIIFTGMGRRNPPKKLPYDLAMYNLGTENPPASLNFHHYNKRGQAAVHYMRCEPRGREILIGNMQIDNLGTGILAG